MRVPDAPTGEGAFLSSLATRPGASISVIDRNCRPLSYSHFGVWICDQLRRNRRQVAARTPRPRARVTSVRRLRHGQGDDARFVPPAGNLGGGERGGCICRLVLQPRVIRIAVRSSRPTGSSISSERSADLRSDPRKSSKKKLMGTWRTQDNSNRRDAATRFRPRSYFWTC